MSQRSRVMVTAEGKVPALGRPEEVRIGQLFLGGAMTDSAA